MSERSVCGKLGAPFEFLLSIEELIKTIDVMSSKNSLLHKERKQSVLLYVALGNSPAERAYKSVGFGGLLGDAQDSNLDTEWLELGFDGTDLGHW